MEEKDLKRFHSYIRITPGCWIWLGVLNHGGYGECKIGDKLLKTHRIAYQLWNGEIPPDLIVRHRCHNTQCVNPEHLILGTHAQNKQDCIEAGRTASGSRNGNSKLKEEDVSKIKELLSSEELSAWRISRLFGVTHQTIKDIKAGRTWKHI